MTRVARNPIERLLNDPQTIFFFIKHSLNKLSHLETHSHSDDHCNRAKTKTSAASLDFSCLNLTCIYQKKVNCVTSILAQNSDPLEQNYIQP